MTKYQRLKKVVNWLIYQEKAANERELADILGYTKSSFSQIMNGKVPLSDKFIKKLCSLDDNINEVWITIGAGSMFKNDNLISEQPEQMVTIPVSAWIVIQAQAESLASKDKQVDELIGLLKGQLFEFKKIAARQDDNAECKDVG